MRGRKSTPGRYFQVANPGSAGAAPTSPIRSQIIESIDPKTAWPGVRMLMVSTTGEDCAYFVLDESLRLVPADDARRGARRSSTASARTASRRSAPCCSWAAPAARLRAGVTENPVALTRSVKEALTRVTCGGAPAYVWPGGGITVMVDVMRMPDERLRLGADAGDRRADRVHAAARRLRARSAATWTASAARATCSRDERAASPAGTTDEPMAAGRPAAAA